MKSVETTIKLVQYRYKKFNVDKNYSMEIFSATKWILVVIMLLNDSMTKYLLIKLPKDDNNRKLKLFESK